MRKRLPAILEDAENELSPVAREIFAAQYDELVEMDLRIKALTQKLVQLSNSVQRCSRFKTALGVGPMTSTAL